MIKNKRKKTDQRNQYLQKTYNQKRKQYQLHYSSIMSGKAKIMNNLSTVKSTCDSFTNIRTALLRIFWINLLHFQILPDLSQIFQPISVIQDNFKCFFSVWLWGTIFLFHLVKLHNATQNMNICLRQFHYFSFQAV